MKFLISRIRISVSNYVIVGINNLHFY